MKLQNRLGTLRLNKSLTKQKQGETKLFLLLEWHVTKKFIFLLLEWHVTKKFKSSNQLAHLQCAL